MLVYVKHRYIAQDEDELSIQPGDVLDLIEEYDDGWCLLQRDGDSYTGLAPLNHLNIVMDDDDAHMNNLGDQDVSDTDIVDRETSDELDTAISDQLMSGADAVDADHGDSQLSLDIDFNTPVIYSPETNYDSSIISSKSPPIMDNTLPVNDSPAIDDISIKPDLSIAIDETPMTDVNGLELAKHLISNVIIERINHEFSKRDKIILDEIKSLIDERMAAWKRDNSNGINGTTAYPEQHSAPFLAQNIDSSPPNALISSHSTPRNRQEISNKAISSKDTAQESRSKIPKRVSLPKINIPEREKKDFSESTATATGGASLVAGHEEYKQSANVVALPELKPTIQPTAKPQSQQRGSLESKDKDDGDDDPSVSLSGYNAYELPQRTPLIHKQQSSHSSNIVEPVADGFHYSQCRSKVYGPSYPIEAPDPLSGARLVLHHVYGYDGDPNNKQHPFGSKGKNVLWIDDYRIVYPAAAIIVINDVRRDSKQGFFCGHTDKVTCIAIHPSRQRVASAQGGKESFILIWEPKNIKRGLSVSKSAVKLLSPSGMRSISGLDYSGDGRFLVAAGVSDVRWLIIFDCRDGSIIVSMKVGHNDLTQALFNPYSFVPFPEQHVTSSMEQNNSFRRGCYTLVSYGGKHIKFWTLKGCLVEEIAGLESISSFHGRKLVAKRGSQQTVVKYTLEGNLGVLTKAASSVAGMEITSVVVINDNSNHPDASIDGTFISNTRSRYFFGTSVGSILIWQHLEDDLMAGVLDGKDASPSWLPKGKLLSVVMELHDGPIIGLDYCGVVNSDPNSEQYTERIISSSTDGIINVWQLNRNSITSPSQPMDHLGYIELHKEYARSISWNRTGSSALLGTAENSILLLKYDDVDDDIVMDRPNMSVGVVLQSHHGRVHRLAVHPIIRFLVASISSDKTIRLWDFNDRVLVSSFVAVDLLTAVTFSPDGSSLVVGAANGDISVYQCEVLTQCISQFSNQSSSSPSSSWRLDLSNAQWMISRKRNIMLKQNRDIAISGANKKSSKKCQIVELKYNPVGDILAVACKDNAIHLMSANNSYKRYASCRGHNALIQTLDFSVDGSLIQSVDASREIFHWDSRTGLRVSQPTVFRDAAWDSWSSVIGWAVQGVYNKEDGLPNSEGDIICVDRSSDGRWLVAGGASSSVHNAIKVFNFPCLSDAVPSYHGGHTSPVVDISFVTTGGLDKTALEVATAGGNDACLIQWRLLEYR